MRVAASIVPLMLGLLSGCAASHTPAVPVSSAGGGTRQLDGEWQGDFWSSQTGRHGRIWFRMAAGADSATGQVLMFLRSPSQAVWRGTGAPGETRRPSETEWLSIRFVDVESDSVSGAIEPYTDPLCSCLVRTTFLGRFDGRHLEGTYTSRALAREYESGGRWSAQRK
jgi:hypothetical protein